MVEDTEQLSAAPTPISEGPPSQLAMENQRLREAMVSQQSENMTLRSENQEVADHLHKLSLTSENNAALVQAAATMASADSSNGLRILSASASTSEDEQSTGQSSGAPLAASSTSNSTRRLAGTAAATATAAADDLQSRGNAAAAELALLRAELVKQNAANRATR